MKEQGTERECGIKRPASGWPEKNPEKKNQPKSGRGQRGESDPRRRNTPNPQRQEQAGGPYYRGAGIIVKRGKKGIA